MLLFDVVVEPAPPYRYVVHHTSVNVLVVKGQRAGEPREEGAATRFAYAFDGSDISKSVVTLVLLVVRARSMSP